MKKHLFPLLSVALLGLASCSSDEPQAIAGVDSAPDAPIVSGEYENAPSLDPLKNVNFFYEETKANNKINDFSFRMLNAVAKGLQTDDKNLVLSHVSASMFLTMVANSCDEKTAASISDAMGYDDMEVLNKVTNQLMRYLPCKDLGATLHLANSVWYHNEYTLNSDYIDLMNNVFGAAVNAVDMRNRNAINTINSWCSENTNGMIPAIWSNLPGGDMAWVNAVYFDCEWKRKFEKALSKKATFHGLNGDQDVNMMRSEEFKTYYRKTDNCELVAIPYKGDAYRMVLALPAAGVDVCEFTENFNYQQWEVARPSSTSHNVKATINMPSFEVENSIELNNILSTLGIDLSRVSSSKIGLGDGVQSITAHQKVITIVNEEGTKGASVTGGGYGDSNPEKIELTFDRPFLFFVENIHTGSILLAGRVCNF